MAIKPDLLGVAEAAEMFGVKRPNFLRDYAARPDFPKPIARLRCGPIWLGGDLRGWQEDRDRGWLEKDK
jgi:predicted DNA-binding transcriptional regulator AlpA